MLEKPDLPDETLASRLRDSYGMAVTRIDFLPAANDSSAWVYRVHTDDGKVWFLKVKKGIVDPPGLIVPRFLKDSGI